MNSQSEKSEKRGFRFSYKIKDSTSLILAARPCAAGSSELIRASPSLKSGLSDSFALSDSERMESMLSVLWRLLAVRIRVAIDWFLGIHTYYRA
jgi:hypothetical protein